MMNRHSIVDFPYWKNDLNVSLKKHAIQKLQRYVFTVVRLLNVSSKKHAIQTKETFKCLVPQRLKGLHMPKRQNTLKLRNAPKTSKEVLFPPWSGWTVSAHKYPVRFSTIIPHLRCFRNKSRKVGIVVAFCQTQKKPRHCGAFSYNYLGWFTGFRRNLPWI